MKVVTIAARKGGSGKSTLAAHLSVLAQARAQRVLLIDVDPQGSLGYWFRLRAAATPPLIECEPEDLAPIVAKARRNGYAYVIIDTPPHAERSILDAMRQADLVLIPTRPGPFDLAAVGATLALAARRPALVVLNQAPPSRRVILPAIVGEAREAISGMGGEVAGSVVAQRVALSHAIIAGQTVGEYEPGGRAAREVATLWREIQRKLKDSTDGRRNPKQAHRPAAGAEKPRAGQPAGR
jgi:chromosome partitioning protein